MIKKIDWYIMRKFFRTFFFTVLIFAMISSFIDMSEKMEKFVEEDITLYQILGVYYPGFIMYIVGLLWPLFTLISVIFFTSRMAANSEVISIFNAGVSFRRFLRPYLITSTVLALILLAGNHYFIPKGNVQRLEIEHKYIWRDNDKGKTNDVHAFISPNEKVYFNGYQKKDSTARLFRLERYEEGKLVYMFKANNAKFLGEPDRWRFRNYEIRTFDGIDESLVLGFGKSIDTTLNVTPEIFVEYLNQQSMLTTPELIETIEKRKSRGVGGIEKYQLELYRRTAEAFTIIILTLIGVSLSARKVRGGLGLHLALGIGLGALYILISRFAIVFAMGQTIPPLLGIWLPNISFFIIALILVAKSQK